MQMVERAEGRAYATGYYIEIIVGILEPADENKYHIGLWIIKQIASCSLYKSIVLISINISRVRLAGPNIFDIIML